MAKLDVLSSLPPAPKDTIAALATPSGVGGISIIRVSGPRAHEVARTLCPQLPKEPEARRAYRSQFRSPPDDELIDEGLVLLFFAPSSFTGEDVLELHGHGGPAQSRSILEAALEAGCRAAGPGEFSRRAVENGRIDLARAEGMAELVAAESEASLRAARSLLGGALSARIEVEDREVEKLVAELEAAIDFPEDSGDPDRALWLENVLVVAGRIRELASTWKIGSRLRGGSRVVLIGPPNSGKSSILNALSGYERALVDAEPGTTRDLLEARVELEGHQHCIVDGAGLRDFTGGVEAAGMERIEQAARGADLVVGVFDVSAPPGEEERRALCLLGEVALSGTALLLVANKIDLGDLGLKELKKSAGRDDWSLTCAKTGCGIQELGEAICRALPSASFEQGGVVVSLERHHRTLLEASRSLFEAASLMEAGEGLELVCEDLQDTRAALGEIVGRGALTESLLDEVFARFCIGK